MYSVSHIMYIMIVLLELKFRALPPLEGTNKGRKMNKITLCMNMTISLNFGEEICKIWD